jgi:lysine-specific demethylase 8
VILFQLPDCLQCGTYRQKLQEAEFWMSSGGTASLLHSHDDHNLHCVLFGRKDFILIEGKYKDSFEYIEKVYQISS